LLRESANLEIAGMAVLMTREAWSKTAATAEYVSLIPQPFCHLQLSKGSAHSEK
jgi:hypothetical protein